MMVLPTIVITSVLRLCVVLAEVVVAASVELAVVAEVVVDDGREF